MALQNFVAKALPSVSAAWLNAVDIIKFTIFGDATTKAAARTALTSDLPLEIANGGTAARTAAAARTALGSTTVGDAVFVAATAAAARTAIGAAASGANADITSLSGAIITRANLASAVALVYNNAAQTLSNNTDTKISFQAETQDTATIHDNATNNTRLTVPTGYLWARLTGLLQFTANATGYRSVTILKNNAITDVTYLFGFGHQTVLAASSGPSWVMCTSLGLVPVVAGDYFELSGTQTSGGNLDVASGGCAFAIELFK